MRNGSLNKNKIIKFSLLNFFLFVSSETSSEVLKEPGARMETSGPPFQLLSLMMMYILFNSLHVLQNTVTVPKEKYRKESFFFFFFSNPPFQE